MIYLTELNEGLPTERVLNYRVSQDYPYLTDEELKLIEERKFTSGVRDRGFTVEVVMDYHKPTNQSEWRNTYKQVTIPISKVYKTKSEAEQKLKEIIKDINNLLRVPEVINLTREEKELQSKAFGDWKSWTKKNRPSCTEYPKSIVVSIPNIILADLSLNLINEKELLDNEEIRNILTKFDLDLNREIIFKTDENNVYFGQNKKADYIVDEDKGTITLINKFPSEIIGKT